MCAASTRQVVRIDHTPVIVRDLEAARARYTRLGFNLTPICYHSGRATANHLIMFDYDYTELVGLVDPAERDPVIDNILRAREGICLVALASANAAADRARMADAGYAVSAVLTLERPLDFGTHSGVARFKLVLVETPEHPLIQIFFTQHLTPDLVWIPRFMAHPNGACGISAIIMLADEPRALRHLFECAMGSPAKVSKDGIVRFQSGPTMLEIIPANAGATSAMGCDLEAERPYVLGQTLRITDPDRTAACLEEGGITYRRDTDGTLTVASTDACGVLLRFSTG